MAFTEDLKAKIRKRALHTCCMCKKSGVIEIHHILPVSEGGPDIEDNAAPLCPSCHEIFGANPTKRKNIKEARDALYESLAERAHTLAPKWLDEILESIQETLTASQLENFMTRANTLWAPTIEYTKDARGIIQLGQFRPTAQGILQASVVAGVVGMLVMPAIYLSSPLWGLLAMLLLYLLMIGPISKLVEIGLVLHRQGFYKMPSIELEAQEDGHIQRIDVRAECPICGGNVRLWRISGVKPNMDTTEGLCQRNPSNHRFSFDHTTFAGILMPLR